MTSNVGNHHGERGKHRRSISWEYSNSSRVRKRAILLQMLSRCETIAYIAKTLKIAEKTVYNSKRKYEKQGLINKNRTLTSAGKRTWETSCEDPSFMGNHHENVEPNDIRLHWLKYKIKILRKPKTWNTVKNRHKFLSRKDIKIKTVNKGFYKTEKIIMDDWWVELNKDYALFQLPNVHGKTAYDAYAKSVHKLREFAIEIQKQCGIQLLNRQHMEFEVVSNHYALIKNALAKEYNSSKQNLLVFDDEGKLRLLIDNSENLDEIEAVHGKKGKEDSHKVQTYFKDVIDEAHYRPSEAKQKIDRLEGASAQFAEGLHQFQNNLQDYNKNLNLHMDVQNNQNKNLALMTEVLKDLKRTLEKANLGRDSNGN